jgi:integrase
MPLPLPGFEGVAGDLPPARRPTRRQATPSGDDDSSLVAYLRRLAAQGVAPKGLAAYRYQLRSMRRTAARLTGRELTCLELFRDETLLGHALVDTTAPTLGTMLSKWTLAQRRSAIRSFAMLMRPELLAQLGEEPGALLDRALRRVAERVGTGYRLTGGVPRRRGGTVPTSADLASVLTELGRGPGYLGLRDRAFFTILVESGTRVNALRQLEGSDCVALPSGRLRIFVHDKGRGEPREVELSHRTSKLLQEYADSFNRVAAAQRRVARVCLGESGPVWRNSGHGTWGYDDIRSRLRLACAAAEVPAFAPHALRRVFATDAASLLPRAVVAQAGGWSGVRRLDDHYVQPRAASIWDKLAPREGIGLSAVDRSEVDAPASAR